MTVPASIPTDAQALRIPCFHCGLPCPEPAVSLEEKAFCCAGCQTVFRLLTASGLGRYYELNSRPGRRVGGEDRPGRWRFLDEPAVQGRLLDFADSRQMRVTFHLPSIHCIACVWLLENLFRLHPGIGRSQVNFGRREASITFDPGTLRLSEVAALLESIGYEPALNLDGLDNAAAARPSPLRRQWLQVGVAFFAFGNIMLMALPVYFGLDSASAPWFKPMAGWLGLALALPVLVFSAADYWRAAWLSLRQRVMTLDVPIALGLAAIYGQSVYEVISRTGGGYSDSLTGLIFFLLLGRLFQQKTHERLSFDRDYKGFFPLAVTRLRPASARQAPAAPVEEEAVSIAQLAVGDRLLIRHGELIPADATLVSGEARLDYSFVTGEAEPVSRVIGERLYAGGRQTGGAIEIETVKPVSESYLASLWSSEAFRKPRRDNLDTITNRYSRRFTLWIAAIAAGAGAFWLWRDPARAMKAFTSVLIVACPCALALAAPLTLGSAQRLLGRWRVYLKSALVMERLAEIDTVVLDKTGTLTSSDAGAAFVPSPAAGTGALQLAASLARHSAHPHSVHIAGALEAADALTVRRFSETPGSGIEGEVHGHTVLLGSASWLQARDVDCRPVAAGNGQVWLAVDGVCCGHFTLTHSLRPEVDQLMNRLQGRCQLALLSGDNAREATCFRRLLGPEATLRFQQSPMDKLDFVRDLEQRGQRVMMVGDGLNDAGALRQASVGVAVVERNGAFSPASDVILEAAQLPRLAEVLEFARRSTRVVRAGFVLSGLYNVVGVSIAAAGLLSPLVCAVLMPLSSASVVLFAVGATRWAERRVFRPAGPGRKDAFTEQTGTASLLTSSAPRRAGA